MMIILLGLIGIVSCFFSPLPPFNEMKEAVLFSQLFLLKNTLNGLRVYYSLMAQCLAFVLSPVSLFPITPPPPTPSPHS